MNKSNNRCPNCFCDNKAQPCASCGWEAGQDNPPPALGLGRVLDGRYRIGRVLGHGGFGITYLAWDENLQLRLAIKEYLPRDCAGRAPDGISLAIYSGPAGEQFAYGLDRFLEEARALAHFDQHPGIVTVKNFFRAHGTGYCVMDYVDGITLRDYLEQQPGGRISFDAALKLLMPVMDALRAVHKEGLLHRDIAPDNIYLTQDGRIKLLDFGAARFAAGEHSKSLSVILKPGYAPEEQYRTKGHQGPWTDVYGLAATFYRAITGQVPPEALDRLDTDELVPPSRMGLAITPDQEAALLKGLAVKARERYQSMAELQQACIPSVQPLIKPSSPSPLKGVQDGKGKAPDLVIQPTFPSKSGKAGRYFAITGLLILFISAIWQLISYKGPDRIAESIALGEQALEQGNYAQAQGIFMPLAKEGDALAQVYIGFMYEEGLGVSRDYSQAIQWYRKSAEQGNADAQYGLGGMFLHGLGVQKDEAEAMRWYQMAAEQGDADAQNIIGVMYSNGEGITRDETESVRWYRMAADQGHAPAQFNLGYSYANGQGVAKNEGEAVQWYRKAAEQGDAHAQNFIGVMYTDGKGVAKDEAEAVRWYRKAAEQGHAAAQGNLGFMYANGLGVIQDQVEAVHWYRKAAEQGDADAQFDLGIMYENGKGIAKNKKEAVNWYRKAAQQDHAEAKAALKRLGK